MEQMATPSLSVVVPTYNRRSMLTRLLTGLATQTAAFDAFEVVVISDGSTDGTNELLAEAAYPFTLRSIIFDASRGPAEARNQGVAVARGALVLFLDDDVVPSAQLIAEHLSAHAAHREEVVVLGPLLAPPEADITLWVRWELAMFAKQYRAFAAQPAAGRQFWTGNASAARAQVIAAGGFNSRLRRFEDIELGYRLADRGLRFVFNPRASGSHWSTRSYASWVENAYALGRHDVAGARDEHRGWPLETIWHELGSARHPLVRALVHAAVGRSIPDRLAIATLRALASASNRLKLESLVRMAYSGIFNLRYYQGIADELGGRKAFLAGLAAPRANPAGSGHARDVIAAGQGARSEGRL
jgi:glycosyltransferase involved in cell wall biosynthesis